MRPKHNFIFTLKYIYILVYAFLLHHSQLSLSLHIVEWGLRVFFCFFSKNKGGYLPLNKNKNQPGTRTWDKRSICLDFFKLIQVGPPRQAQCLDFFLVFYVLFFIIILLLSFLFSFVFLGFFICSFPDIMKWILSM